MTFKEIQELIKLVGKSNLTEFKMKNGDFEVAIRTKKYGKYREKLVATGPSIIPMPSNPIANVVPMAASRARGRQTKKCDALVRFLLAWRYRTTDDRRSAKQSVCRRRPG